MIKGYKYRLDPTPEQIVQMEKTFGCCRYVYNWALDLIQRKDLTIEEGDCLNYNKRIVK